METIYRADQNLITSRWSRFSWASRASWHARHSSTSLRSTFTYWMIRFIPWNNEILDSNLINNQDNVQEDFILYLTLLFLLVVLVDPLAPSFPVHPAFHLQPLHVQELLLYLQEVLKYSSLCCKVLIKPYLIKFV